MDLENYEFPYSPASTLEEQALALFEIRFKSAARRVGAIIANLMGEGKDMKTTIWNEYSQKDLQILSLHFLDFWAAKCFRSWLLGEQAPPGGKTVPNLSQPVQDLLWLLYRNFCFF